MSTKTVSRPKRRVTQPPTSIEAAASMSEVALSALQTWVLAALERKAMTDSELVKRHQAAFKKNDIATNATPQRVRTVRKELEKLKLVAATGEFRKTPLMNRTQVWGVTS
ncbi:MULTISPECIES: hypothetical protein [unclassified Cryobacterium]|uniref:hypothetical protein n=1 Tax=unclassified Cryobacterium TaxID=2649013 RepID=UPI00106B1BBA|nr:MULTISPECIES: hypothetical protein [unclassified Cryobacterium]TFB96558.1 hypothetical protein E3O39_10835 [Cryobacterium sp. MDB2-A-1]TFC12842.1 hypothetical protein E3O35_07995 [Cryobacterium sp. MDB2-A-2]